ncbi:hypothetical protein JOE11_002170 [Robbsia andropogonis]
MRWGMSLSTSCRPVVSHQNGLYYNSRYFTKCALKLSNECVPDGFTQSDGFRGMKRQGYSVQRDKLYGTNFFFGGT